MITGKEINENSMFSKKLHEVAEKYGVEIIADDCSCRFHLANIDSEHTEDDCVNYKFNVDEEKFVFDSVYQLDEINSSDLPQDIEYHSDFVKAIKIINNSVYEKESSDIVKNATLDDLKNMWDESKHIGEFYEKLKAPPFIVTNDVLKEFEGFIKDNGIDIYQSFLDGVYDISDLNEKEFNNEWKKFTEENKNDNKQEEKID